MSFRPIPSVASLSVFYALSLLRSFAGEDPARFMSVTSWRGTFGQDMSIAGSGPFAAGTVVYSMAHRMNATVALCPFVVFGSHGIWQSDGQRIPNAGTITERQSAGDQLWTADGNAAQGAFSLIIDATANQYSIQCPSVLATTALTTPDATVTMDGGASWGPMVTRPLPTNGLVLSGSAVIPLSESGGSVLVLPLILSPDATDQFLRDNSFTVSWNIEPAQQVEVVVSLEPSYENWVPEADLKNQRNEFEGNNIKITAELLTACATGPVLAPEKFRFELVKVSREPGVCMNYPPSGNANTKPDLRFNERLNPANKFTLLNEGTVLETLPGNTATKVSASLSAYDFGAYATLKVTALVGGVTNVGYLKADPARPTNILLPKRQEPSKIADAWKDQHQVRDLADEDDSDNTPVGDKHKGDGFSLYQEYRGFSEKMSHIRTNPDEKDFFVRNKIGGAETVTEILKFARASGLRVHHKLQSGEMAADGLMTVNAGWAALHPQNGIYLRGQTKDEGESKAVTKDEYKGVQSTPGTKKAVLIHKNVFDSEVGGIVQEKFQFTSIAHELAHCCSVWHHGSCDPGEKTWIIGLTETGDFAFFEDGAPITVCNEAGTPVSPSLDMTVWLGGPEGQHSGNTDCLMCYGIATAFHKNQAAKRYLAGPTRAGRTLLCESRDGTGINGPGNPYGPRFGNAHENRGECKTQICVNDAYKDAPEHKRKYPCP